MPTAIKTEPRIGVSTGSLAGVTEILNTLLADEQVLYAKTRNYHWNVTGPRFHDLHIFLEQQYEALEDIADEVAEYIRQLDRNALGTMTEYLDRTRLGEEPGNYPESKKMVHHLLEDHESIIRNLRVDLETCTEKYHEVGATDFLTALMEKHQKMAWMLRSMLES